MSHLSLMKLSIFNCSQYSLHMTQFCPRNILKSSRDDVRHNCCVLMSYAIHNPVSHTLTKKKTFFSKSVRKAYTLLSDSLYTKQFSSDYMLEFHKTQTFAVSLFTTLAKNEHFLSKVFSIFLIFLEWSWVLNTVLPSELPETTQFLVNISWKLAVFILSL